MRWSHDPAQPDKSRHESEWLRGPLAMTDAVAFADVVLVITVSIAMHNIIVLDGMSKPRFGQAARPPTVVSDRGAAVEAFEPEIRAIAQNLRTERFEKARRGERKRKRSYQPRRSIASFY